MDISPGITPALGIPALLVKEKEALVIGDLHIGMESRYSREGVHFGNSAIRMGTLVAEACERYNCKRVVLLGDIKESIGFPDRHEYEELMYFFAQLRGYEVLIAKGNHDSHGSEILGRIGIKCSIDNEILLGRCAFLHGNSWPSEAAMLARYLVCGHGHFALDMNSSREKVFISAKVARGADKHYKKFNKNCRMILVPAFSSLILGTAIEATPPRGLPALKNGVFDWKGADVFSLSGKRYGKIGRLTQD